MIVEAILNMVFGVMNIVIGLLPNTSVSTYATNGFQNSMLVLLVKGLEFFPLDLWLELITNIVFWLMIHVVWSIIEWTYKKIPGVD